MFAAVKSVSDFCFELFELPALLFRGEGETRAGGGGWVSEAREGGGGSGVATTDPSGERDGRR